MSDDDTKQQIERIEAEKLALWERICELDREKSELEKQLKDERN